LWLVAREQTDDWATVSQDSMRLARRLRERQRESQEFFATAAAKWDKLRRELYGQQFTSTAMLSLLPSDYIVADLGCGTGGLAKELAVHVKRVIGVDNSLAMLKSARKLLLEVPNVDLRQGDLAALPIESAACDGAILVLALTYAPQPDLVLREAARILKPGGTVSIVDLLPHDHDDFRRQMGQQHLGFANQVVQKILTEAGLEDVVVRALAPEESAKGPALFAARGRKPLNPTQSFTKELQ
ncbi:MAG: class I SAM-dependent methyltransferase, partial [Tepidisphaeraceae bacterium]